MNSKLSQKEIEERMMQENPESSLFVAQALENYRARPTQYSHKGNLIPGEDFAGEFRETTPVGRLEPGRWLA